MLRATHTDAKADFTIFQLKKIRKTSSEYSKNKDKKWR